MYRPDAKQSMNLHDDDDDDDDTSLSATETYLSRCPSFPVP